MSHPVFGPRSPLRDPGITHGPYRVLRRTDDRVVLMDLERLPLGEIAWLGSSVEAAEAEAHRLVAAGSPIVVWVDGRQRPYLRVAK